MKRLLIAIVILFSIIGIAAIWGMVDANKTAAGGPAPSIQVDGSVYFVSREVALIYPTESEVSGHITSTVPASQFPTENDQANFNVEGQPYIWIDGTLYFKGVDASWYVCHRSNVH